MLTPFLLVHLFLFWLVVRRRSGGERGRDKGFNPPRLDVEVVAVADGSPEAGVVSRQADAVARVVEETDLSDQASAISGPPHCDEVPVCLAKTRLVIISKDG